MAPAPRLREGAGPRRRLGPRSGLAAAPPLPRSSSHPYPKRPGPVFGPKIASLLAACRSVVAAVDAHFGYDLEDPRRSRLGPPVIASSANGTAAAALAAALVAFRRTPDPGACFAKLAKGKR